MARERRAGGLDGILVLAKPEGPTSHDVVALVRRLTGTRRVGHGGTLDPFASGVLPVFLGLGTRIVEYHMGDGKAYRATVCFGMRSTTDDRDGELEPGGGPPPDRAAVEATLAGFRGQIEQRPPAFSALKIGGRRAYQLAREGNAPELAARSVRIDSLNLVEWDASDPERPTAVLEIECGAGTYIRALARDIGEQLGCGAYLGALVRTASGPFRLERAHDLDALREAAAAGGSKLARLVLPIDTGLEGIPTASLDDAEVVAIARGQQVRPARRPAAGQEQRLRLLDARGTLVGMGVWRAGRVVPDKVFVAAPPPAPRPAVAEQPAPAGTGQPGSNGSEPPSQVAEPPQPAAAPRSAPPPASGGPAPTRMPARLTREPRLRMRLPEQCIETAAGIEGLRPEQGRVYIAVGVFDGLHRGHLYLLRHLRRAAARTGARPAVITFDAHPEEIVRGVAPPLLCDPGERLVRLSAAGVEVTVVQHFDAALRATTYDRFIEMIRERVEVAGFLMTPDAAFGYERRGTPEAVRALGERDGYGLTLVAPLLLDGEQVRSSEIRRDVAEGRLDAARRGLGRPLAVTGRLVDTGGPAVELRFDLPVALPPAGRYAVLLGPAWQPGEPADPATVRATAVIGDAALALEAAPGAVLPGDRVRVVFEGADLPG